MCGITGIFDTRGKRDIDRAVLDRMNESQFHRGPDEGGMHLEPGVGLGHRRLSIIDLATGQQPLFNEDSSVCVVFNGEIYNYQELIPELQALGHVFHTRSDTEVIVHAWEAWGEACVDRFRGMFAFALWDRNRETLFLARDRLGVKPLFYALLDDGTFLFGSELKSLLAHGGLKRDIDPLAVEEYFALGYVAEPRTIFSRRKKAATGPHPAARGRGQPVGRAREYWDVRFTLDNPISDADASAELIDRLRESVRLRMISEVPLGAFLSGGVDSSAVVAIDGRPVDRRRSTPAPSAFPIRPSTNPHSPRMVADRYQTNHHLDMVDSDDFDLIDTLARLYDEPYADSSAIPTYRVCQLARKHVTVALSGDGGDESFGGYRRYRLHLMEERMRSALPLGVAPPAVRRAGPALPQGRLGAARLPRQDHLRRHWPAIRSKPISTVSPSCARRCAISCSATDFKADARRLQRPRGLPPPCRQGRHRRPAGPDPVPRPQDLPGRRHQHQGRPGQHGALAGSARAADGSRTGRMAGHPALLAENSRPGRQMAAEEGHGAVPAARRALSPQDGLLRCRSPAGSAARSSSVFSEAMLGPRLADTGCFNRNYLQHLVDDHINGSRDYSAPIWTLLMFEAFLRNAGDNATRRGSLAA